MPGRDLVPRPAVLPPAVTRPPWQPENEPLVPAWRWIWQRRHWTAPVVLLPAVWLAGLVLHVLHWAGYAAVAGVIVTAAVAVVSPHKWDRVPERIYAIATAAGASGWLLLAAAVSPLKGPVCAVLVLLTGAWGFLWWRHKRPRGYRRRQKLISRWDAWWQSHAWSWSLGGSKVVGVWPMGVTAKVRVQGVPGRHSIGHIRQVMPLIESGADGHADIGMVRAEAVKGKPSQFDLFFKRENPLRQVVEFDMSLAPKSVHEPLVAGMTESGTWKMISARRNRFILGETRSGKSNDLLIGLAQLTGCPDDCQILIDLKGGRSGRPVLEAAAVDCVITEVDEARMVLRMLEAESLARSKYAYTGEEQLRATAEVPAIHLLIDETNGLTSTANGDTECAAKLGRVASLGNGLEIYTWVYTQHGSLEESVRTEQTRANLPLRSCYRVAEARHGQYAIPEYNQLDASKLEEKGTCYIKDGPSATPEQVRAPHMPHALLKKIAAQNTALIGVRRPLALYCGSQMAAADLTWQQWWDSRWLRLDPAFHQISPQYQARAASLSAVSPAAAWAASEPARFSAADAAGVLPSEPGEGDAASAAERIRRELAQTASVPESAVRSQPNLSRVITSRKDAFAVALSSAPAGGISPRQLMDESRMASTWVHQMLRQLTDDGAVTKLGRGRYAAVPGRDISRAMDAAGAAGERLYREARETVDAA